MNFWKKCIANMSGEAKGYKLAPRARRDLAEIWRYTFETWSLAQADAYYGDIISTVQAIAGGRKRGKPIDQIRRGYLTCSCGSHWIVYRQRGAQIVIIRILHQRMNLSRHL
jgi:toxin ParE1/3/4